MYIKQLALPTFMILATLLSGCAMNNDSKVDRQPPLISDQQVKEYVEQWQQQQDSIQRLADMEGDLQLLIMALSSNSKLSENPTQLRSNNTDVIHKNDDVSTEQQVNISTPVAAPNYQATNSLSNSLPGAQVGLYLKPQLVRTQIARLHRDYPQAFSNLKFVMTQRENKGVTLYGLRVGPFQDYTEANTFCLIAQNMGQKCTSAPFVGQPL